MTILQFQKITSLTVVKKLCKNNPILKKLYNNLTVSYVAFASYFTKNYVTIIHLKELSYIYRNVMEQQ